MKDTIELAKLKRDIEEMKEKLIKRNKPQRFFQVRFEEPLEYTEENKAKVCMMFGIKPKEPSINKSKIGQWFQVILIM